MSPASSRESGCRPASVAPHGSRKRRPGGKGTGRAGRHEAEDTEGHARVPSRRVGDPPPSQPLVSCGGRQGAPIPCPLGLQRPRVIPSRWWRRPLPLLGDDPSSRGHTCLLWRNECEESCSTVSPASGDRQSSIRATGDRVVRKPRPAVPAQKHLGSTVSHGPSWRWGMHWAARMLARHVQGARAAVPSGQHRPSGADGASVVRARRAPGDRAARPVGSPSARGGCRPDRR